MLPKSFAIIVAAFAYAQTVVGSHLPRADDGRVVIESSGSLSAPQIESIKNGTAPEEISEDFGILAARCSDNGNFNVEDATILGNWLFNNGARLVDMPSLSWYSYTLDTARLCIANAYIFVSTKVSARDASIRLNAIKRDCCASGGSCRGGVETGYGVDGLQVRVTLGSANRACRV